MIRVRTDRDEVVKVLHFEAHGASLILLREMQKHVPMALLELAGRRNTRVCRIDLSTGSILDLNKNTGVGV